MSKQLTLKYLTKVVREYFHGRVDSNIDEIYDQSLLDEMLQYAEKQSWYDIFLPGYSYRARSGGPRGISVNTGAGGAKQLADAYQEAGLSKEEILNLIQVFVNGQWIPMSYVTTKSNNTMEKIKETHEFTKVDDRPQGPVQQDREKSMAEAVAIQQDDMFAFVAKICNQANKAYCEQIGDYSIQDWEETPDDLKASLINGVKFQFNNPLAEPSASHDNWLAFKRADGWKYGPEKSVEFKQHPAMIPYNELPEAQRRKDSIFKAICNALLLLNPGRSLTQGEYIVDVAFNPGGNKGIEEIKMAAARFINTVGYYAQKHPEAQRLKSLAITNAEQASMFGVKSTVKSPQAVEAKG